MINLLSQKLNALLRPVLSAVLLILLTTGCVTTGLATAASSPWQTVPLSTSANPLDVAFTDANHGFLVGSNRLVMETKVRELFLRKGVAASQIEFLDALLKLRQACCDARLVPIEQAQLVRHNAKLSRSL